MSRPWCMLLALALVLGACGQEALPPVTLHSVEPTVVDAHQEVELRLRFEALLPVTLDYRRESVSKGTSAVAVWIGGRPAPVLRFEEDGTLVVRKPAGLAAGAHDVRLVLADGREAVLVRGLSVHTGFDSGQTPEDGPPAPGTGEDGGVPARQGGFTFEDIGEQARGEAFPVTLRAVGPGASGFQGMVTLRSSRGSVSPARVGPFVDGVLRVEVTLDEAWPHMVLQAEDEQGHQGRSNVFRVRPH